MRSCFLFTGPPKSASVEDTQGLEKIRFNNKLYIITHDILVPQSQYHPKVWVKSLEIMFKNKTRLLLLRSMFLIHKIAWKCKWGGYIKLKNKLWKEIWKWKIISSNFTSIYANKSIQKKIITWSRHFLLLWREFVWIYLKWEVQIFNFFCDFYLIDGYKYFIEIS